MSISCWKNLKKLSTNSNENFPDRKFWNKFQTSQIVFSRVYKTPMAYRNVRKSRDSIISDCWNRISEDSFQKIKVLECYSAIGFWYFVIFNLDLAWWNYTIRMSVNWRERVLIFCLSRLKYCKWMSQSTIMLTKKILTLNL